MDRRNFLIKSAFYLSGSFWSLNFISKAFGCEAPGNASQSNPKIALIIDDIGYSTSLARKFTHLGIPITFSVLPRLPNSKNIASDLRSNGHEIMMHQPMEPYNIHYDPGPGALYVGYDNKQITRIMEENISEVPFAVGVNNHMGSRFTSCQKEIKEALRVVKNKGLFFVDSLTTNRSKAYCIARSLQISSACRNIFLDNIQKKSAILHQLFMLKNHAIRYGRAVGIGHPFPETANAIGHFINEKHQHDISFVHASKILST